MESFKSSGWPLAIIVLLMLVISVGGAYSCSSAQSDKNGKSKKDSMTMSAKKDSKSMSANKDSMNVPEKIHLNRNKLDEASFTMLSSDFVQRAINGKSVQKELQILKNINPDSLDNALNTDRKRITFWINMYNGFTQYFLKKDPSLYKKDRNKYFDKNQIHIAGYTVSFNDIEHGILRKGAKIWSKGYVRTTIFSHDFVKKYKVHTVDFRIHFALNCGAKSCPPIVVYQKDHLAEQLNDNASYYLHKVVKYDKKKNVVMLPAFMKWFSADFGGGAGDKRKILKMYDVIPQDAKPEVKYLSYDWTPKTENYKSYTLKS